MTVEKRRKNPGNDLISALAHAEVDGEHLSNFEITGFDLSVYGT